MNDLALRSIELCAGVGMLGEGVRAAFELLGVDHRTVCYVEREAAAAGQLATLMEAGAIHPAPIWSDLLTFDGAAWRGCVDLVVAGFPCQDLSIAGRRAGLNGKRSGLFFNVLDIADACGAWGLVLENVSGIASAGATVVDEEEGELEERAAARVLGELADRGWNAEWLALSAADVGASHGRLRWFCFAWRMADAGCGDAWRRERVAGAGWPTTEHLSRVETVDNTGCVQWRSRHEQDRPASAKACGYEADYGIADGSGDVADALRDDGNGPHGEAWRRRGVCQTGDQLGGAAALADTPGDGRPERRPEPGREQGRPDAAECGCAVADTGEPRLPHAEQPGEPGEPEAYGRGAAPELHRAPLFAPGPADPIWLDLLGAGRLGAWSRAVTDDEAGACPWAPATKPGVRMLVDGMAIVVDESRAHQLRQVGNGVVPLCAGVATVELVRRSGLMFKRMTDPLLPPPTCQGGNE